MSCCQLLIADLCPNTRERIIGIQSFKGSYLRSCNLLPALGENTTDLGQNCGAYVNATTLEVMGYLKQDGTYGPAKGYTCPAGQICMVILCQDLRTRP